MTLTGPAISHELARATDALLMHAIDALEAAGADFDSEAPAHHTLVVPGSPLQTVIEDLNAWDIISCAQGACENWSMPQAKAAQEAYQIVDKLFEKRSEFGIVNKDTRMPIMISGQGVQALLETRRAWISAWKPPRRLAPR